MAIPLKNSIFLRAAHKKFPAGPPSNFGGEGLRRPPAPPPPSCLAPRAQATRPFPSARSAGDVRGLLACRAPHVVGPATGAGFDTTANSVNLRPRYGDGSGLGQDRSSHVPPPRKSRSPTSEVAAARAFAEGDGHCRWLGPHHLMRRMLGTDLSPWPRITVSRLSRALSLLLPVRPWHVLHHGGA
jgi:hypothetical protein